jgi:hypothetical protein
VGPAFRPSHPGGGFRHRNSGELWKPRGLGSQRPRLSLTDRGGSLLAAGHSGAKIGNRQPELSARRRSAARKEIKNGEMTRSGPDGTTEPRKVPEPISARIAGDSRRDSDLKNAHIAQQPCN